MRISNIENIKEHFKLPIFYNKKKMELSENIITDLELNETIDPSGTPIYKYAHNPKTIFGKKILEQMPSYYTTDIQYLKDTQKLLKTYKRSDHVYDPDYNNIMDLWDEIKNETSFREKYHYLEWPFLEHFNKSDTFLQVMSIYNLASPVISFFVPFIILIIPFFVIKCKGLQVSFDEYIEVLKVVASNHAVGKLFTQFNSVQMDEKIYLLVSAGFYLFSIYQNILTCVRFHQNMKKIHVYLNDVKQYIIHTEQSAANFLTFSSKYKSYETFNTKLRENISILKQFKDRLERISEYKCLSIKKVAQYGYILKCFYELYDDADYNASFLYSFGFNGYIDNLEGIKENIKSGAINYCVFDKRSDRKRIDIKSNKKTKELGFKKSYYAPLMNQNPVTNDVEFNKNMIITGPNASGKTTILKSSLINIILTQQFGCGFYSKANIRPFKFIHCYLNIPDTSGRDSLFQAEARRCKNIIDVIQDNSDETHFCVFDELYSGTNPEEAIMSAGAFMNFLMKFETVNCMLTTHFFELCKSLEKNPCFKNVHMKTGISTDKDKRLIYNYELMNGISTIKGGIKVLKDMNYPSEIIANATTEENKQTTINK